MGFIPALWLLLIGLDLSGVYDTPTVVHWVLGAVIALGMTVAIAEKYYDG